MLFPFLLLHALVTTGGNASPANIDPNQDLNALPDNALFTRWRPHFHFLAPSGWLNDPCSALYDPTRDMYHLLYQFHPNHANWGNISWGHATSRDLITWTDVGGWRDAEAEAIGTGRNGSYDHLGIFSGTGQPVSLKGEENGNLTMFYTSVQHLPIGWNREYIVGSESQSLATSSDGGLTWDKYGGNPILTNPPGGVFPQFRSATLAEPMIMQAGISLAGATPSSFHGLRWKAPSCMLSRLSGMLKIAVGSLGAGLRKTCTYELALLVKSTDDLHSDRNDFGIKAQGFQGSMGISRELFVHKTHNVLPPNSGVPINSSATWSVDCNGTYTVTTLGARPLPEVVVGLRASESCKVDDHVFTSSAPLMDAKGKNITADHFELKARLLNVTGSAGFIIRASPALEEFTTITYSSTTNTVSVNRTNSSLITRFADFPVNGYFAPYTIAGSGTEALDIHIFGDGSLVEVFINNRFALTTRVYPSRDDALGIWEYVEDGEASFKGVEVWTDMVNVWPGRPVDSSSALVVDSPEDTGNGAWWSGI